MRHYYESEVLFKLMERDGLNIPSSVPPYESEIKAYLINQVKPGYPKLTDYEAEWLLYNYTEHVPADFPIVSVSNVTSATFENVVPLAYQRAILKGKTLVNLVGKDKKRIILADGKDIRGLTEFSGSKQYTVYFKVEQINNNGIIRLQYFNGSKFISAENKNIVVGVNTITFTTPANTTDIRFQNSNGVTELIIDDLMILEGDYTNIDIPYFEGMQSVKKPVLSTTGKNLFDINKAVKIDEEKFNETNYVSNNNGVLTLISDKSIEFVISKEKFEVNTQYTLTFKVLGTAAFHSGWIKIYHTDGSAKILANSATPNVESFIKITSDANKKVDRISIFGNRASTPKFYDIQVEKGVQSSSYEPYKSNILSTTEDVTLRGIGDVQDELNLLTGELTQRIGEIVLDGSENWRAEPFTVGTDQLLRFCLEGVSNCKRNAKALCDKEKVMEFDHANEDYVRATTNLIWIYRKDLTTTVEDLKQQLQANPYTIQYQLATESVKTVDLTTVNENGESVSFLPLEGTMNVHSSGEIIQPTFDMSVPVEATTQNLASYINLEMEE